LVLRRGPGAGGTASFAHSSFPCFLSFDKFDTFPRKAWGTTTFLNRRRKGMEKMDPK
jgi:hypothetical protein